MNRPRSICLQSLVGVCLFFAPSAQVSGQAPTQQTPGTSRETVLGQILKRVRPTDVARPDRNLPARDTDQPQNPEKPNREKPTRTNPPSRVPPLLVTVPNLLGRSTDDALRLIRSAKLRPGRIEQAESTEPAGLVFDQSLKPDTQVLIGSVIDIRVAQPRPQQQPPPQVRTTIVPRLIGRPKDEAMSAISAAELKLGNVGQKESSEATDQVIGQSLSPGSQVPVGQVIDIVTAQQETTTVPNLVGDSKDEASSIISEARLKLGSVRQEESEKPVDQIIRQSLRPGSRVPVGQVIEIVTARSETTIVPNLVGRSKDQAMGLISGAGLKPGKVGQTESARPADEVLQQSLKPDTRVPVGQTVDIVTAQQETTIVPDVSGLQLDEGFRKLASARLQLGNVSREPRPESHEGVLRQTPAAGSRVPANSKVDLVVATSAGMVKVPNLSGESKEAAIPPSTPAPVRVPDVIGETRDEASTALSQAGFKMGPVREQFSLFHTAGKVYSQEPVAGTLLAAPESVDLIVSTGAPAWAVASFLVLGGTAVGFFIRGRTRALWHKPPPAEQIKWSTRVHKDIGSQQIEHGTIPVGPDIRVRPIIDRGTQSIRETPAVRSDRAA